jgi:hypothetical protein
MQLAGLAGEEKHLNVKKSHTVYSTAQYSTGPAEHSTAQHSRSQDTWTARTVVRWLLVRVDLKSSTLNTVIGVKRRDRTTDLSRYFREGGFEMLTSPSGQTS